MMSDFWVRAAMEAVVLFCVAAAAAGLSYLLLRGWLNSRAGRSAASTVLTGALAGFALGEVWTQFASSYRYQPLTFVVTCAAAAVTVGTQALQARRIG